MTQGTELLRALEAVHDRQTFLDFVDALARDRRDKARSAGPVPPSPDGVPAGEWQNVTIEDFLEAATSWAEDIADVEDERAAWFPAAPSWAAFARFIYAGKTYE
jgi:hypothetical protein